jgi:hypothetical protein
VSNHNLHPVWNKALGLAPQPAVETPQPAATAVAPSAASDGWHVIRALNPRPGATVTIRNQLGPQIWVSTTVRPGDPRYPADLEA